MNLSDRAKEIIACTDFNLMSELFVNLNTPEEVEEFINEYYGSEE